MDRKFKYLNIVFLLSFGIMLNGQHTENGFLKDSEPKEAVLPPFMESSEPSLDPTVTVTIDVSDTIGKVSKYIYGNNANTYMTQMINETDLIDHITKLAPNIIRYPGGNLSSIFFWDALPGQTPDDAPDMLLDGDGNEYEAGYWYGKNGSSWTLSVDNYYQMLDMTGNTGMITINYSYARYGTGLNPVATAAHYAAEWVRYDNGRTRFWEIGNENHGPWQAGFRIDTTQNQDGQPEIISGELYGMHFKVFADSMRNAAQQLGNSIYIGAQLMHYNASSSWNPPERTWNSGFFSQAGDYADFFIIHSYYTPYQSNSPASVILNSATAETRNMMNYMEQTTGENEVMLKPVALTEWNIFAIDSKQSCSFVNGMHAAIVLGELASNHYSMSSRWDLANGYDNGNDHGMFNKGDEPGDVPQWNPRPAFFYMYYFQKYFGDHVIRSTVSGSSSVLAYSSVFNSGHAGLVVVNKDTSEHIAIVYIRNFGVGENYYIYSITGGEDNGEFSQVVYVNESGPDYDTGGPIEDLESIKAYACSIGDEIKFVLPGRSVQYVLIENGENILGIGDNKKSGLINKFILQQNYPNPFNPDTKISYQISTNSDVQLNVYNLIGQKVRTLIHSYQNPGSYVVQWDGKDDLNRQLSSGVYICKLEAGMKIQTMKMILIK